MASQVPEVPSVTVGVPEIVITEPSPLIQKNSMVSIAEKPAPVSIAGKAAPAPEETSKQVPVEKIEVAVGECNPEQVAAVPEAEGTSSGEFKPAAECTDCVVPVHESESLSVEDATPGTSEPDQDDFRTESLTTGCCSIGSVCLAQYDRLWNVLDNRCRLPFWLMLMALPLSAGVMGSLYMFSCPAAHTLPSAVFTIGISLMAVLTLRVCIILHRISCEDEDSRHTLHTLLLISTFVTAVFFITESMMYWQMDSTPSPGSDKFCDSKFVSYVFWWNCAMCVAWVPLFFFPA